MSPKNNKKGEQTGFPGNSLQLPYKCAELPISSIWKSKLPFSAVPSFSKNISALRSGSTKWETITLSHISMDSYGVYLSTIFLEFFLKPVYPTNHGCENRPVNEGTWGIEPHFFWNRTLPGVFSWKFAFVLFSKASKTFLAPALPESYWGPWKSFKFMVLRLLEDTFVSQKKWIFSFLLIPPSTNLPQAEGNYSFHPNSIFWKSIFPQQKGGRIWSWKIDQN